jgi:hypothetical protein
MTVPFFIGTSVDGFVARPNGELGFLQQTAANPWLQRISSQGVDALVIGSNTFETVLIFATWPYGQTLPLLHVD